MLGWFERYTRPIREYVDALEVEQVCGEYDDGPGTMKISVGNARFGNCVVAQIITRFSGIANNVTTIDADAFRGLLLKLLEKEENDPQGSFFADCVFPVLDPEGKGTINWRTMGHGILLLARASRLDKIRICFQMIDLQQAGYFDVRGLGSFLERFWEEESSAEGMAMKMLTKMGSDRQEWAELRPDRVEDVRADALCRQELLIRLDRRERALSFVKEEKSMGQLEDRICQLNAANADLSHMLDHAGEVRKKMEETMAAEHSELLSGRQRIETLEEKLESLKAIQVTTHARTQRTHTERKGWRRVWVNGCVRFRNDGGLGLKAEFDLSVFMS